MDKISIIIPAYNVEKYLDRCIESVVKQTYSNLEIILVNDGSKDSTGEICDKWAKVDSRIIVIHKKNGGLSDSRNAGMMVATGQYMGFIDGDDYIEPDMYESLYKSIVSSNAEMSVCGTFEQTKDGEWVENRYEDVKEFCSETAIKELFGNFKFHHVVWNKLYKIELFEDIEFPVGRVYEDISIMYKVVEKCTKIITVPKSFYNHVYRGDSISRIFDAKSVKDYLQACDELEKRYEKTKYSSNCNQSLCIIEMGLWINLYRDIKSIRVQNNPQLLCELKLVLPEVRKRIVSKFKCFWGINLKNKVKMVLVLFNVWW